MKFLFTLLLFVSQLGAEPILYWWQPSPGNPHYVNFGDELSRVIVERILDTQILRGEKEDCHKLLAVGSIFQFAKDGDVIWGSGINGKHLRLNDYPFKELDIRAVRGPLTQRFLNLLGFDAPSTYGDPVLLLPLLFPELKPQPKRAFVVIPHLSEIHLFPPNKHTICPDRPWQEVIQKILESKLVISSSLHGIIVAEAFGIPARWLRVTENEPVFKYYDYYLGTGRGKSQYAKSIGEAIKMGGEEPAIFDSEALLNAFPHDYFY